MKEALLRMYRSARELKKVSDGLRMAGLGDDPIFESYGQILDSIYFLIGETRPFEHSVTKLIAETTSLDDDRAVAMLMGEYEKNHALPTPQLMSKEQMDELYRQYGGYMHKSTPEGEWT